MHCSNRACCPPASDKEATKRMCAGAGSCQCQTQTMMQVQLHGGSCPLPLPQLPQPCLHFPKPGVKNVNEWCSHSRGTALSFLFAAESQILAGRQADLTTGDTVGVSALNNGACWSQLSPCEEHLLPAVSTSKPTHHRGDWSGGHTEGSEQMQLMNTRICRPPCARHSSLILPDTLRALLLPPHTHTLPWAICSTH